MKDEQNRVGSLLDTDLRLWGQRDDTRAVRFEHGIYYQRSKTLDLLLRGNYCLFLRALRVLGGKAVFVLALITPT
jgi:hypothetical protein